VPIIGRSGDFMVDRRAVVTGSVLAASVASVAQNTGNRTSSDHGPRSHRRALIVPCRARAT